jgi:ACS family tartrate transporter-like MFS transporter
MAEPASVASRASLSVKTALDKARWRILPLLGLCYLVAYMDRANISFAAETMDRDLGFTAAVYGLGAGLFFLSYAACEVPSNAALLRFGARRWLARIMLTWGLLAVGMMFVRGTRSFYTLRLLLGMAEAGYFPGAIYYLSQWFPPAERARAISRFYISLPISTIVMGLAAGSLLHLDGTFGLRGWQWLFLVEGLPALILSACLWFLLPDGPANARWLSAEEREALAEEAAVPPVVSQDRRGHSPASLWQVFRIGRIWALGGLFFCGFICVYGLGFSLPVLLREATGWTAAQVGYLIAASGVAGVFAMLGNAAHSDRTGDRTWHIALPLLVMVASCITACLSLRRPVAAAALLIVIVSWYAVQGPLLGVCTTVVAGRGGAIAIAVINTFGIVVGFLGPYWMGWMRDRVGSYAVGIGALAIPCLVSMVCILLVGRLRPLEEAPA